MESYDKPNVLKSRDIITLLKKVCMVKAMVFPVVMYRCESWTIKKAECWKTDAYKLWCWGRLFWPPWSARRSNQSILKENQPWIFFGRIAGESEAPILWPLEAKHQLTGRDADPGKDWGRRRRGRRAWDGRTVSPTRWTCIWAAPGGSSGQRDPVRCSPRGCGVWDVAQRLNGHISSR